MGLPKHSKFQHTDELDNPFQFRIPENLTQPILTITLGFPKMFETISESQLELNKYVKVNSAVSFAINGDSLTLNGSTIRDNPIQILLSRITSDMVAVLIYPFMYALKSSEARRQYPKKLKMFFDYLKLQNQLEEQFTEFLNKTKRHGTQGPT